MAILRNKFVAKILAVVLACVLWAAVIMLDDPIATRTFTDIPISLSGMGDLTEYELVLFETQRETVSVTVRGPHSIVNASYADEIIVTANVFRNSLGPHYIPIGAIHEDSRLTIDGIRPAGMWIEIANRVSVNREINVRFYGGEVQNTEPYLASIEQSQVEIIGAQPLVEAIRYVEAVINPNQMTRNVSVFRPEVVVLDEYRQPIPNLTLSIPRARVEAMLYDVRAIPIAIDIVGEPSEMFEVTNIAKPQTVRVRGTREDLDTLPEIEAEPIDISDVVRNQSLPVVFTLPEGLTLAEGQGMPHIRVEIKALANASFEFDSSEIEIEGLEEGLTAQFEELTLSVTVVGDDYVIEYATIEDFRLLVDLEGLEAGTHTVLVVLVFDKELRFWTIEPVEIEVTIE